MEVINMYEVINEKLGIKACGLADLTAEQVGHFLGLWEEGAKIGTLTAFVENGILVLNKNNIAYDSYREIAEEYMGADAQHRREIRENCQCEVQMDETFDLMENCLKFRRTKEELFRATHNEVPTRSSQMVLDEIQRQYIMSGAVRVAFKYGVMQGKRMERARKKRQSIIA